MIETFDGYRHDSPTLAWSFTHGDCLGVAWQHCEIAVDPAAPIRSGDFVRLHIRYDDGEVTRIVKELRCSEAGARWPGDSGHAWWGVCDDGIFQLGTLVKPYFIEKVVARRKLAKPLDFGPVPRRASPKEREWYATLAEGAVSEWSARGCPRGVPFPGIEAITHREAA